MSQLKLLLAKENLLRKEAAKIIYEYLTEDLGETDEVSVNAAAVLKDIYDCSVCVKYIATVYLKGIMEPVSADYFGANEIFDKKLIPEIERRVNDKALRVKRDVVTDVRPAFIEFARISSLENAIICDVRTELEYNKSHLNRAVNIPLSLFVLNPHILSDDKFRPVIFLCNEGASAELAANCASIAGYKKVFYTGYNK